LTNFKNLAEETDDPGKRKIKPGMGRKVNRQDISLPDKQKKTEKDQSDSQPDNIDRGCPHSFGRSFKKLNTDGPAKYSGNGDQFTRVGHGNPFLIQIKKSYS